MRALALALLVALAAGCAAGPDESTGDADCPEDASAYHEGGTGGEATGDATAGCPEGALNDSTMETIEER